MSLFVCQISFLGNACVTPGSRDGAVSHHGMSMSIKFGQIYLVSVPMCSALAKN